MLGTIKKIFWQQPGLRWLARMVDERECRWHGRRLELPILFSILALAVALNHAFASRQFGSYDLSPLADILYRFQNGEVPGRDFINTLPLSFILFIKIFEIPLGANWASLVWQGDLSFILTAGTAFLITRHLLNFTTRCLLVTALAIPYLVTNHIWHSIFTENLAILYFIANMLFYYSGRPRHRRFGLFAIAALSGPLWYAKLNAGPPILIYSCVYLMFRKFVRKDPSSATIILLSILGIMIFTAVLMATLAVNIPSDSYTFFGVTGRLPQIALLSTGKTQSWFFWALVFMASYVAVIAFEFRKRWTHYEPALMLWGGVCIIGFGEFFSDIDIEYNDLLLILAPSLIVAGILEQDQENSGARAVAVGLTRFLAAATACLFALSVWAGYGRLRMEGVGDGAFYEDAPLTRIESGFFAGLSVGPSMTTARRDLADFLALHRDADARIFCGPRLEFCYVDNRLPSPKGFPLWWHPGSSFAVSDSEQISRRFSQSHFLYLVFADRFYNFDRGLLPRQITEEIDRCYRMSADDGVLRFFERTCE